VHDPEAPSFRYRFEAIRPGLEARGFAVDAEMFPRRRYVLRVIERRRRLSAAGLLVVAKLKLLPLETGLTRSAARRIVYDFDDAVYVGKPDRIGEAPGRSRFRVAKFSATCRMADVVVAGNDELAGAARPYARRVEIVPTGIDLSVYSRDGPARAGPPTLVWIGLPGNLPYLELVRPALAELAAERPDLTLRIVSSRFPDWPEVPIDRVVWSESTAPAALSSADIGIMPLADDAWTRGKGGFKLLQYMAARLPCVASPVGANRTIVAEGETGFLPRDEKGWLDALRALLDSPARRREMGEKGRQRVEEEYSIERIAKRTADLYEEICDL
jgi:glycosyltransferase involved in cell wall biosynthesis